MSIIESLAWVALGVGFVVTIVVLILLQLLLTAVNRIQRDVIELWHTATTFARNTATTWLLNETANTLGELKAEVPRHEALLAQGAPGPTGNSPPGRERSG